MRGRLLDDALEVIRADVTVVVLVEVQESLPYLLALQAAEHLCELWVCHRMPVPLAAQIQLGPVAVPIERDGRAGLIARICLLEAVEVYLARRRVGEETEGDFVLGIGLREEVVEHGPVL